MRVYLALVALLGCSEPPAAAPTAVTIVPNATMQSGHGPFTTRSGLYRINWAPEPETIPLSALFDIRATVEDVRTGKPLTEGSVHIDARMPQHGHGMATRPEDDPGLCAGSPPVCTHPDGVYRTHGMKFHMQGAWVVTFDIQGPAGSDRAEVSEPI